jgi:hypothetical protein
LVRQLKALNGRFYRRFPRFFGRIVEHSEITQAQYALGENACDFAAALVGG